MRKAVEVSGDDKIMVGISATGEAQYMDYEDLVRDAGKNSSTGIEAVSPGPLPNLGESKKSGFAQPGTYTQSNGPDIVVPEGNMGILFWDGNEWELNGVVEMPMQEGTDVLEPELIPKGKAVADYTKPLFINTLDVLEENVTLSLHTGVVNMNGSTSALETNWRRSALSLPNITPIDLDGHYTYTGTISNDLVSTANNPVGVAYYDSDINFISYQFNSVGSYVDTPMTIPANASYIVTCSYLTDPVIKKITYSQKEPEKVDGSVIYGNIETEQLVGIEETKMFIDDRIVESEEPQPTILTTGALTNDGGVNPNVSRARRTSNGQNLNSIIHVQPNTDYYYTGRMGVYSVGVAIQYYDINQNFIGYDIPSVSTEVDYVREKLTLPPNTAYIACCSYDYDPIVSTIRKELIADKALNQTEDVLLYVDAINGNDENTGSSSSPFKSITKAIQELSTTNGGQVIISSGDYRETLDFASLESGRFSLKIREGHKVRVLGSVEISGFTKTDGFSNVYEADFHGTIPNWSRADNPIFEDGRPSMEIDFTERHPLHKNLKYRLPFSPIYSKNNLTEVDSTPGSYFYDTATAKIYIHTSDSINPNISNYKYEVIQRNINTYNNASTTSKSIELYIEGIQFMYHTLGVISRGFKKVHFVNCVSLASIGAGAFRPDTGLNIFEYCEAGFCNNDGFNGHFSGYSGYQSLTDNRSNYPTTHYIACWGHDNFDDGESSHEHHNVYMDNCLFEYNTKSGCMPSNDATYLIDDTVFRFNSGRNFGLSVTGYGLASVNPPSSENRIGVSVQATNCISYGNDYGYGILSSDTNKLYLSNCVSRNNLLGEYRPNKGKLTLDNCKASNPDSNKIIIKDGTGTFEILKDDIII